LAGSSSFIVHRDWSAHTVFFLFSQHGDGVNLSELGDSAASYSPRGAAGNLSGVISTGKRHNPKTGRFYTGNTEVHISLPIVVQPSSVVALPLFAVHGSALTQCGLTSTCRGFTLSYCEPVITLVFLLILLIPFNFTCSVSYHAGVSPPLPLHLSLPTVVCLPLTVVDGLLAIIM